MAPGDSLCVVEALLGALPQPAFVVDENGALLSSNAAAREFLSSGLSGLRIGENEIALPCGHGEGGFAEALGMQLRSSVAEAPACIPVWRNGASWPMILRTSPIDQSGLRATLVTVHELEKHQQFDSCMLERLFCLTRAEARVAAVLGEGCDLMTASQRLGITPATIRFQLKSIFRKLGIRRQQDLVRLVTHIASASANNIY